MAKPSGHRSGPVRARARVAGHGAGARTAAWLGAALGALAIAGCRPTPTDVAYGPSDREAVRVAMGERLDTAAEGAIEFETLIRRLAGERVVYIGERHDRFDHHLNQLAVIRALHERDLPLAIGLEFFQQPFQGVLDRYVTGEIDERAMLRESEYYARWRFDYRLYAPILRYAREHGIRLIALNLPPEITGKAGREGIEGLSEEERAQVPGTIDREVPGYRERLREVFEVHPVGDAADGVDPFDRFETVQLLWDEGMAERAAEFLRAHPGITLVVLAGTGHVAYGTGIPTRLERRTGVRGTILVNDDGFAMSPHAADYILVSPERRLPKRGLLGVMLDTGEEGVRVLSFMEDSAAHEAGIERGDRLTRIAGRGVQDMVDVRLALWDKAPGDTVAVTVERGPEGEAVHFEIPLR